MDSLINDTQKQESAHKSTRSTSARTKYAWRACQECRRRRAKCDGSKPSCSRCIDREIDCVYATGDDNRGTAPKSYVRLLQTRISILEQVLRLHSIDVDAAVAQMMASDSSLVTGNAVPSSISCQVESLPQPEDSLNSNFAGALCFDQPSGLNHNGGARYFGPASGRLELAPPEDSRSEQDLSPLSFHQLSDSYSEALHLEGRVRVSEELMSELIDLYFEWEHPWLQILDEELFRSSKETNGRYFSILLLNCVLAIGSRYSDRVEVRSDPDDPNTAGQIFLESAEVLLHFDLKRPSVVTIQCLEIMAMIYVAIGSDTSGWLHHGMAVRLALDMGFNIDPSIISGSRYIPSEETDLRRQIYWSLYCTDKLWASYTGRVCTMLDSQGLVNLQSIPTLSKTRDSIRCPRILALLNNSLSTHCQILEKIMCNLYAPKTLSHEIHMRGFFDSCLLTLKGWYFSLPPELRVDGRSNILPQAYTLVMVYHTSLILLAKPFLVKRENANAATRPGYSCPQEDGYNSTTEKAKNVCIEAAKEICLIGNKYRQTFGSFRKSPITATHCTLSAALVSLHLLHFESTGQDKFYTDCINSCIKTLQELSVSWTPPRRFWPSILKISEQKHWAAARNISDEVQGAATEQIQGIGSDNLVGQTSSLDDVIDPDLARVQTQFEDFMFGMTMPLWSDMDFGQGHSWT